MMLQRSVMLGKRLSPRLSSLRNYTLFCYFVLILHFYKGCCMLLPRIRLCPMASMCLIARCSAVQSIFPPSSRFVTSLFLSFAATRVCVSADRMSCASQQVRFLAEEQFEKRALRHRITAALQQAVAQQQQQQMMQQPFGTQQPPAGYRPAEYPAQPPQIGGYSYGPSGIPYGSS